MVSSPQGSCGAAEGPSQKSLEIVQLIKTRSPIETKVNSIFSSSGKETSKQAPSQGICTAAFHKASGALLIEL